VENHHLHSAAIGDPPVALRFCGSGLPWRSRIKCCLNSKYAPSFFRNVVSERHWIRRAVCKSLLVRLSKDFTECGSSRKTPFSPPKVTIKDVHDAVPKELLQRKILYGGAFHNYWHTSMPGDQIKSTYYIARHIAFLVLFYKCATYINPLEKGNFGGYITDPWQKTALKVTLWLSYYWFQGLVMAGIFCLGAYFRLKSLVFPNSCFVCRSAWCRTHVVVREQIFESHRWFNLAYGKSSFDFCRW